MKKIAKVDPYLPHYVYEKQVNPASQLYWRQFHKEQVEQVDRIVEISRGNRDFVKTLKDWEIVEELVKFFATSWPNEFEEFKSMIPDIRGTRRDGGYSESKEIRYVGAFPVRLGRLIKAVFVEQQFDKKFVNRFVKKFPLFKVGGENNLSKGGIIL
jgi:hypothetical protein